MSDDEKRLLLSLSQKVDALAKAVCPYMSPTEMLQRYDLKSTNTLRNWEREGKIPRRTPYGWLRTEVEQYESKHHEPH